MNLKYYLRGLGLGIVMAAIALGITASGKKAALTEEEIIAKAKDLGMVEEEELEEQLEAVRAETEKRVKEDMAAEYAAAGYDNGIQGMAGETEDAEADGLSGEGSGGQEEEGGQADGAGQEDVPGAESERQEDASEAEGQGNGEAGNTREEGGEIAGSSNQANPDGGSRGQAVQGEENNNREQREDAEPESDGMTERGMAEGEKQTVFIVKKGESPYSIGKRMEEEGLLPKDAGFDRYLVDHGYDTKVVAAEYEIPADADMETIARIITKQN